MGVEWGWVFMGNRLIIGVMLGALVRGMRDKWGLLILFRHEKGAVL